MPSHLLHFGKLAAKLVAVYLKTSEKLVCSVSFVMLIFENFYFWCNQKSLSF